MKRIEAIFRPIKLDEVKIALGEIGVTGMTASDVRGSGRQRGHKVIHRGDEFVIDLPTKVKLEMIVRDEEVEPIIDSILLHARTGEPGDGKIFVLPVEDAVRVRTSERGEEIL
jgi:nitrogen regulatory protein P-II 1